MPSAPLLALAMLALLPITAAEGIEPSLTTMGSTRECSGDRTTWSYESDDGQGRTDSWSYTSWDEQCTVDDDLLAARVGRDGETVAGARAGERFTGASTGTEDRSNSTSPEGSGEWRSSQESREGSRSRGIHAEAVGEEAAVDVERCQGDWSTDARTYESTNSSSWSRGSGHSESCEAGLFMDAAGESAAQPVITCEAWGYERREQASPAPADHENATVDYRSCRGEAWIDVLGMSNGATVWSGHWRDCTGAWNGTAHETQCSEWGGEWTSVHVGAAYNGRDVTVPFDVYGLLLP